MCTLRRGRHVWAHIRVANPFVVPMQVMPYRFTPQVAWYAAGFALGERLHLTEPDVTKAQVYWPSLVRLSTGYCRIDRARAQ